MPWQKQKALHVVGAQETWLPCSQATAQRRKEVSDDLADRLLSHEREIVTLNIISAFTRLDGTLNSW